jgi:hypothetical protein
MRSRCQSRDFFSDFHQGGDPASDSRLLKIQTWIIALTIGMRRAFPS